MKVSKIKVELDARELFILMETIMLLTEYRRSFGKNRKYEELERIAEKLRKGYDSITTEQK